MSDNTKRVIALGFFDGVHRGHAALLQEARESANSRNAGAAALTFDRHPENIIIGRRVPLISSKLDREQLMRRLYGIDEVIVERFDRDMMHMEWDAFLSEYLIRRFGAVYLVAGHDYKFGYMGQGNAERLAAKCRELGVGCSVIPKVQHCGITVSSTYIRGLIAQGEMERANTYLGHPHCMTGIVVHGRKLGRTIDIPTANLIITDGVIAPAFGVYATKVIIDGMEHLAVTNVGVRPTVGYSDHVTVEPYILDFSGDLYGKQIRVDFYRHLRGERRFDSLEDLKLEIHKNAAQTRAYFAQNKEFSKCV